MSSYQVLAKEKATGKTSYIWCIDDYFGKHKYGYLADAGADAVTSFTEEQFEEQYEIIEQI
jgi:hypothetical protein